MSTTSSNRLGRSIGRSAGRAELAANPDAPGSPVTVTIGIKAVALRAARAAAVSKL